MFHHDLCHGASDIWRLEAITIYLLSVKPRVRVDISLTFSRYKRKSDSFSDSHFSEEKPRNLTNLGNELLRRWAVQLLTSSMLARPCKNQQIFPGNNGALSTFSAPMTVFIFLGLSSSAGYEIKPSVEHSCGTWNRVGLLEQRILSLCRSFR